MDSSALLAVLLGGAALAAPRLNVDPGPSPACPADMRLVDTVHYDDVEHLCVDWRESVKRCFAYHPQFTAAHGPKHLRFCMDQFEGPNERGKKARVMDTFPEAQAFCASKQKRLCSEFEWEAACEQNEELPWQYGWQVDKKVCNSNKAWKQFDEKLLGAGGETAKKESDRLWQGQLAGEFPACQTKDGVRDLMGNVEEWVTSSRRRKFPGALMGGFWAKPWTGCRGTNDAHDPAFFRFYEVGLRCCAEPEETAPIRLAALDERGRSQIGFVFPESEPMTIKSLLPPRRIAAVVALAFTAVAGASLASDRIFLDVPGFPGGAIQKGFEDNFEVLTLSLGYSTPAAGQLTLTPVTITKNVDKGSAAFLQAGAQGKTFGPLLIRASAPSTSSASSTPSKTEIRLYNARIVEYRLVDTRGTGVAVEQITFAVSGYDMAFTPAGSTVAGAAGVVGDAASSGGK